MLIPLTLGALIVIAIASSAKASASTLAPRTIRGKVKGNPNLTLAYARKWGPIFGAPVPYILTLAHIESSHVPGKVNMASVQKGGAWGLVQQMADEVPSKLQSILSTHGSNPEVLRTVAKWKGNLNTLLDPDFNVMLAAWQIGRAKKRFGNFKDVAAAYHQGAGGRAKQIAEGKPLPPKGAVYVSRALSVQPLYENVA